MVETTSDTPQLISVVQGGIAWITISNPQRMNAFTASMWAALPGELMAAEKNPAVRVIVLRGAGAKAFSAGADISEFDTARSGDAVHAYDRLNHEAFAALLGTEKPIIAMIHGFCLGGGFGIAACCDLRLSDEAATFAIPAAKLGLGYNARWIKPLLSLAGPAIIKEMLFTGRRFGIDDAKRMGLLNLVVPAGELEAKTRALADEIAANAPLSVRAAKLAIDEIWRKPEHPELSRLDEAVRMCFESEDYAEGRRAFLEKRKPQFQGK